MSLSEPSSQTSPPIKRKRGRPPKANKPEDAFPTFTMQLESSPLATIPNAELISSQVVRSGEPDSFTPMMKVSPSPRRRKRRKSTIFSLPLDAVHLSELAGSLELMLKSYIVSLGVPYILSHVLENLSSIMNDPTSQTSDASSLPENVLLPAFLRKRSELAPSIKPRPSSENIGAALTELTHIEGSLDSFPELDETGVKGSHKSNWSTKEALGTCGDLDLFDLELVVDESGRASVADRRSTSESNKSNIHSTIREKLEIVSSQSLDASPAIPGTGASCTRHQETDYSAIGYSSFGLDSRKYETDNDRGIMHNCSLNLEPSMYHVMEMNTPNYKSITQADNLASQLPDLASILPRYQDLFDKYSVDTLNLMLDESRSDILIESADARHALRKVFNRKDRCTHRDM